MVEMAVGPAEPRAVKRQFLTKLSALRFFGASAVFLAHAALALPFENVMVGGYILFSALPLGFIAVSFFFMLSGFVLTWSMRPGDTFRGVIRRRLVRIFPPHLVCLAAVVGVAFWAGRPIDSSALIAQIFLLQAWIPDLSHLNNFNSQTWTLSAELFFYAMFPAGFFAARRLSTRVLLWLIGVMMAMIVAWSFVVPWIPSSVMPHPLATSNLPTFEGALNDPEFVPEERYLTTVTQFWAVYHFPVARLAEFLIGVSVAELVVREVKIRVPGWLVLAALVVAVVVGMRLPILHSAAALVSLPALLFLLWGASAEDSGGSRMFTHRIWITLGNLTFGLYLVHGLVLDIGHRLFGTAVVDGEETLQSWSTLEACWWIAVAFVISLALAWVLYTFVENQIMRRWGRR